MTPKLLRSLTRLVLLTLSLAPAPALTPGARAQGGTDTATPILRVEAGAHSSTVYDVALDARQRYLASASYDKTVRVWDAATGDLLGILRPPIPAVCGGPESVDAGEAGKLYAVAVSPDGKLIACGGWSGGTPEGGYCFYVFDRVSGQIVRRVGGLTRHVYSLAFSPDGRWLAAGTGPGNDDAEGVGVRLYRTSDWGLAGADTEYAQRVFGLDFLAVPGQPGRVRLAACCEDGKVRLYAIGDAGGPLRRLQKYPVPDPEPYSVAFSPDGRRLAVGFDDSMRVLVLACGPGVNAFTGARPAPAGPDDPVGPNETLLSVAWSADGGTLYAAGQYEGRAGRGGPVSVRRWGDGGRAAPVDAPVAHDTMFRLRARRAGGVFWGDSDGSLGALDAGGRVVFRVGPVTPDLSPKGLPWRVSGDGRTVAFGYGDGDTGAPGTVFSVAARGLAPARADDGLAGPVTDSPDVPVRGWWTNTPTLNGKALALDVGEVSHALAVAPDGRSFILGTGWNVRGYAADGSPLWPPIPTPADTLRVNVSGDGRVAVAGLADGTIHWYRMSDGRELLALFPDADRKRWVAWTPSGYYDCSAGGEDLIGWHVNRGVDQAADFFPASRFRDTFYRPDVVARVLTTLDEGDALAQADLASGRAAPNSGNAPDIRAALPPVVAILSPPPGSAVTGDTVTVQYSLRTPSGLPAVDLRVLIDGRPAGDPIPLHLDPKQTTGDAGASGQVTVAVPARDCTLSLIAENDTGASVPASVALTRPAARQIALGNAPPVVAPVAAPPPLPTLYVLAVGVSRFQSAGVRALTFPGKDAADFVRALQAQKGRTYKDVIVYDGAPLTDAAGTKDAIEDGLQWLQDHATDPNDVAIVYLSGHGYDDPGGDYYYVPYDFDLHRLKSTGLPGTDIFTTVKAIPARVLVFDDTCYAGDALGRVDTSGFINALTDADNGAIVFAAATGDEEALEDPSWQNGAFTKAVVEALDGHAAYDHTRDYDRSGVVDFNMLTSYTCDRVKDLTGGRQQPASLKPLIVPDFPLAQTRAD